MLATIFTLFPFSFLLNCKGDQGIKFNGVQIKGNNLQFCKFRFVDLVYKDESVNGEEFLMSGIKITMSCSKLYSIQGVLGW